MDKSVREGKKTGETSTQKFLPFSEIRDDLIILKNGGVRAILKTSTVNFNLKSEEEQKSLIVAYQGFLNTLSFPIQILIRSRRLDIDNYIHSVEEVAEKHTNEMLKTQTKDYAAYVKKLVEYANIMDKQFYVIVPIDGIANEKKGLLEFITEIFSGSSESASDIRIRLKNFEKQKVKIKARIESVHGGLSGLGIEVNQLKTAEIIELIYQIYNPETAKSEKFGDITKSDLIGIN